MQWDKQIKNITQTVSFKLSKIKSAAAAAAAVLIGHTKKLLINALVIPYFHYCSTVWASG